MGVESQVPQGLGWSPQSRARPLSKQVLTSGRGGLCHHASQGSHSPRVSSLHSVGPISPHELSEETHNSPCDAKEAFSTGWKLGLLDLGFSSRPSLNCNTCPWECLFIQNEKVSGS